MDNLTPTPEHSLTLLDLQRMVRATLESRFHDPLWISAEISELKVNRSGHCYLNLVEKGATDGAPRAEARAVIWKSAYLPMASMFEAATGATLRAGLRVLVRVVVSYHEVYGFSLQIIDLDPRYTLGEVERRRRETIARLQQDGVWDMNHELTLPRPTLRIAIVSSDTAAGYQDFMNELNRNTYRFETTLFRSLMQGDAAEESVINALNEIAARESDFDVVAIIRGGGSTSDLALFDSYLIASYVAQFPLPIFSGIGHDKDVSVVDMVAHTSLKTPTAVATKLVEMADYEMTLVENLAADITTLVENRVQNEAMRIYTLGTDIERHATSIINTQLNRIDLINSGLYSRIEYILSTEEKRIDNAKRSLESYSIDNILRLGFAVARNQDGAIRSIANTHIGESIDIELIDGSVGAEIKSITPKTK
ncbi:MAG: exodeoxyribonuclease VII large subunit [Alistipes sp.]|nr:exodeoxyribonuclease VII large subunit [Alistipes sp.]